MPAIDAIKVCAVVAMASIIILLVGMSTCAFAQDSTRPRSFSAGDSAVLKQQLDRKAKNDSTKKRKRLLTARHIKDSLKKIVTDSLAREVDNASRIDTQRINSIHLTTDSVLKRANKVIAADTERKLVTDSSNIFVDSRLSGPFSDNSVHDSSRHGSKLGVKNLTREPWIIFLLLCMIGLLAVVKARYPKDLRYILQSLFNDRIIKNSREYNMLNSPSFLLMFALFCACTTLMIYDYLSRLKIESGYEGLPLYGVAGAGIFIFLLFKILSFRVSAQVFGIDKVIKTYLSIGYVVMCGFTLFTLPFLVIYALYNMQLVIHLSAWIPFIIVVFLIILYVRSIVFIISNYQLSKFYLFLYFCAFEICPLIIVYKVLNA